MGRTTGRSRDFTGKAEEDPEFEGSWTRWGPNVLGKEFYQLT